MEGQLSKKLTDVRFKHNTVIAVEDFREDLSLQISISHSPDMDEEAPFQIQGKVPEAKPAPTPNGSGDTANARGVKRKMEEVEPHSAPSEPLNKKARLEVVVLTDDDVVELE